MNTHAHKTQSTFCVNVTQNKEISFRNIYILSYDRREWMDFVACSGGSMCWGFTLKFSHGTCTNAICFALCS